MPRLSSNAYFRTDRDCSRFHKYKFFRWGHWLRYVKETIISGQIRVFAIIVAEIYKVIWEIPAQKRES